MKFSLIAILPALLCAAFAIQVDVDSQTHYYGYKVYRVLDATPKQVKALIKLEELGQYDFWSEPVSKKVDIMAAPAQIPFLIAFFTKHGMTYEVMIDNVEDLVEAERTNIKRHKMRQGGMDWISFHSYDEIIAWADSLASVCPNIISSQTIGTSTEGRALRLYKISTGGSVTNKTSIWIDSTFHAREWLTPAVTTYFLNELCQNTAANMDYLEHVDFYVVPFINPDGYEYSRDVTRMWRKTRSDHDSPLGCLGVDPNRNFDLEFGGAGTSNDKCSDIYRGPNAFSEPEVVAVRDFLLNSTINWQVYITVHTYGQYILIPYSYASVYPPDYIEMEQLASNSANALTSIYNTVYTVGQSADTLGPTAGCADDWAKGKAGIKYAYTYELRDTGRYGFVIPPEYIIPSAEETIEAFKYTARTFIPQTTPKTS